MCLGQDVINSIIFISKNSEKNPSNHKYLFIYLLVYWKNKLPSCENLPKQKEHWLPPNKTAACPP
jgi:hypothetical protein